VPTQLVYSYSSQAADTYRRLKPERNLVTMHITWKKHSPHTVDKVTIALYSLLEEERGEWKN
jgi:hypothetical protein